MKIKAILSCLLLAALLGSSVVASADTFVIPFSDIREEIEYSGDDPDEAIRAYLIDLIRAELDSQGFNVDADLVFSELSIDEITDTFETDCDFPRPFELHTDPTTATLTLDDSSSLTVVLESIRSIEILASLTGIVDTETNAWVKWGQDVPFVGDCKTINKDHGWVGLTVPFGVDLSVMLDLDPSYDADQVAIVVDKRAVLSGQAQFYDGDLRHDFGTLSLTDLVLSIFEDDLLAELSEGGAQAVADAITGINYRLDGLDENGLPDPTIEAFNGPTTYVLEVDETDRAFIDQLLQDLGVPDIVLAMVDEQGAEILLQLVVLEGAERDAYLAELGAQVSCEALFGAYKVPLDIIPLYEFDGQSCATADLAAPGSDGYYADPQCSQAISFRPTDDIEYCLDQFGDEARTLLGNAASWLPDIDQPGDELPTVESRSWTTLPSTQLDLGVVSLQGNHQPYVKQVNYKTIDDVGRGIGTCELEMRVYKSDITEQGLRPLLALHGGTWKNRGSSFIGLEASMSQFTERGFVVFAPFYRLVGESDGNVECNGATWREVTADVESALAWVTENGSAFGAADEPVSVFGQSAGAHLAAWLAANQSDEVRKVLLYYPPLDALDFAAGALPPGGPYESFRDFGLSSLVRFFGAEGGTSEVRLDRMGFGGITPAHLTADWSSLIPATVFDISRIDSLAPPAYLERCAASSNTDLTTINLSMPPDELVTCMKQDLSEFLVGNSFIHQLQDEPMPFFVVHGHADTVVPYQQAIGLCGAAEGSVLPVDVVDPLTVYSCGAASRVQVVKDADHALELGVCLGPLCPAGEPGSATRNAVATTINESYLWLMQDVIPVFVGFDDVPPGHWAFPFVEATVRAGISSGCGNNKFCPDATVTRAQMSVFLERGMRGGSYQPPPATGTVFGDVGAGDFAANFIEQLAADGITAGCGGGMFCPDSSVTRAQMAVFLLRAKYGASYSPPPASGLFSDVAIGHWSARWVEQMAAEGITSGCGGGKFCPGSSVTRAQMAVFLVRTFGL
jgi:acetyl esterase/lipase